MNETESAAAGTTRRLQESSPQNFPNPPKTNWTHSAWADFVGVFCIFVIYAGGMVPAINEPHYWSKAAHFWNHQLASGDLFLESGDAHWLFFATFGALTQWLPITWSVWVGRLICWVLLAVGWTRLCRSLWQLKPGIPQRNAVGGFVATCMALGWLVGMHWGHWAGEWVIGGSEAKCVAYGMIFMGLAWAVEQRWTRAWIALGIAAAFHVVTGIWVIACVAVVSWWMDRPVDGLPTWIKKHALGLFLCMIGVIAGAIPAIAIDWGIDPQLATESAIKQVYTRLGHHLAPSRMNDFRWQCFACQLLIGSIVIGLLIHSYWNEAPGSLRQQTAEPDPPSLRDRANRVLRELPRGMKLVIAWAGFALSIALIGLLIDWFVGSWSQATAAKLLRFYWFRWNDVTLPLMISAIVVAFAYGKLLFEEQPKQVQTIAWIGLVFPGLALLGYRFDANFHETIPAGDKAHFAMKDRTESDHIKHFQDWLAVCDWIRENTDANSLWLTPRRQQSFKWRTGRPELASWKDAPQNAKALVEWGQRLSDAYEFDDNKNLLPWTTEKLWELHAKYGVRYVLLDRRVTGQALPKLPLLYPNQQAVNESFAVFEFPPQRTNTSE